MYQCTCVFLRYSHTFMIMKSTRYLFALLKIIHDNKCINICTVYLLVTIIHDNKCINIYTMYLLVTIIHDNKFVNRPPCDMYLAFHIHVASKGPFFVDVNQHYITISLFATPPLGQLLSTSQLLPDFGAPPPLACCQ